MTTGFLGTPYLLHALARNGYIDRAYGLLLEERAPSWLFSVKQGATTIWEHWDSLKEDGSFWSAKMNSFNHYAYGSVFDWIFEYVGGISVNDGGEGYTRVTIAPIPNKALGFADIGIKIRGGELSVRWEYENEHIKYEIQVPEGTVADIRIPGVSKTVSSGKYIYYSTL
jgi:alpha-L-rhamnosidase